MLYVENYQPEVMAAGLNTNKDAFFGGDVTVEGTLNATVSGVNIPDATSSTKGKIQLGNDLSGSAAAPQVNSRSNTQIVAGVGQAGDQVATGTADNLKIAAATAAIPSTGGTATLRASTFNIDAKVQVTSKSNITIEGEGQGATILNASSSIYSSSGTQHYGIISIQSHTALIENITIRNMTIDCNRQLNTQAITITGGSAAAGVKNILIENVTFKNMGATSADSARAFIELISGSSSLGTFGNIEQVTIRNCRFEYSEYYHIYFLGENFSNVTIENCYFTACQDHSIVIAQQNYRTNKHFKILKNKFIDTLQRTKVGTISDIIDSNGTGIIDFQIIGNYHGPQYNPENVVEDCIVTFGSWGLEIAGNYFDGKNEIFSTGKSFAGSYFRIEPNMMVKFHHNFARNIVGSGFDPDSTIFMQLSHNDFHYFGAHPFGGYSRHWPTTIEFNNVYNCGQQEISDPAYQQSAFETNGEGTIIRGNTITDDQLLPNTTTGHTITQAAGCALGARTYSGIITWWNNTGETQGSSAVSFSVSANNLATFTLPTAFPYPSGAIKGKVYAHETPGSECYQGDIDIPYQNESDTGTNWQNLSWTEPSTGLVTGTATVPLSNTTHHTMLYGIYQANGGISTGLANEVYDNHMYGIETPIFTDTNIKSIRRNNFSNYTITTGGEVCIEDDPYAQGNITGATTFDPNANYTIAATFTGSVTSTVNNGQWVGQVMTRIFTMGGAGSYTYTKASNEKLDGGSYTPSSAAGQKDILIQKWDGANWNEISRRLNIS